MNDEEALKALSGLSNRSRLAVIRELVQAGPDGRTAGGLARSLDASPSQMSFHLSNLADSGLVTSERKSRNIIYRSDVQTFQKLIDYLLKDCCPDRAESHA